MKTNTEKSICVKIPLSKAEMVRKKLKDKNFVKDYLKIHKDREFLYIPITAKLSLNNYLEKSYKLTNRRFDIKEKIPKSYKDLVNITDKLKEDLPTSFDTVGDIILLKLKDSFLKYQAEIGKALLKTNKNIKTVCLIESVSGEFRTRKLKVISGEKNMITNHKEYGLDLKIDISNAYFSPRLANERRRITNLVKKNEIIIDMFAGVAPFSIMIAKFANPKIVYAVDKNKYAVKYAKLNVKKNNVLDKVEIIHSDAKDFSLKFIRSGKTANRIIMNLPFSAFMFFSDSLKMLENTGYVHYYDILNEKDIDKRISDLRVIAGENHKKIVNIKVNKIKSYSPREFYIGIDITAKNNADVA